MNPQPKRKRHENKKYLAWVRKQPCCYCGRTADHAHHLIGTGNMGGMGTKAPDWTAMPVCSSCHRMVHDLGDREMIETQWEKITRTLGMAIEAEVLK